jgi:hypothetical protein
MQFVAIARAPAHLDEAAKALADATGITLAEARMRLAPEPPALLARLEPARAEALAAALRKAGLAALTVDVHVPSDAQRTVAHAFTIADADVTFTPRFGDAMQVAWPDVLAVLRGLRAVRSEVERTDKTKRLSLASAAMGIPVTRTSSRTVRSSQESTEQVILVYARDGRTAALGENALDFSCLGPGMQPSSTGNMLELARRLRERARGALYDERLLRLGRRPLPFLAGGESRTQTATTTEMRVDTGVSLDVLAEVMRRALVLGLLP